MAIYLGLEIRARRRNGRPVGLVGVLLVGFALLSLAAQVAEAEPSVWGWIVAAVPSLAFLALVKVVLSSASAPTEAAADRAPVEPVTAVIEQPVRQTVPTSQVAVPVVTSEPVPSAVRPPLGVVRPDRPQVVGIVR